MPALNYYHTQVRNALIDEKAQQASLHVLAGGRGDCAMDPIESLRDTIACVFRSWEEYPSAISTFRIVGVMDTARDRYTLTHVDFQGERFRSRLLC